MTLQVGGHGDQVDPIAEASARGATLAQFFLGDPQAWKGPEISYAGVMFAPGSSQPLHPYGTIAVDPDLIPAGSRIYVPAYRKVNGGWFTATDTGGAIIGRHIDVYRPPTGSIDDGGRYLTHQRVYVKPPSTG